MLASHRTWTEFLRQSADPIWWAKKAIDYQRKSETASARDAGRAQHLAESIWLISTRKLSNREAIKLLVARRLLGREPSRALALFTARAYQAYLKPADTNLDRPTTRSELVRFLLRRRFAYYPEWMRDRASRKRDVDMDSLPESQIVQIVQQFMQLIGQGYSEEDALRRIERGHSFPGSFSGATSEALTKVSGLPEPLTPITYVRHRLNQNRRIPLPDEFIAWAVARTLTFFENHAPREPATDGAPRQALMAQQDSRIERLRVQAERRNPEAQFRLAKAFLCGEGVRQDLRRGLFWIALARRNGHAGAELLFEKFRKSIAGTALERLLAGAETAADQYETFSDMKVPRGGALITDSSSRRSCAGEASAEPNSI